MPLCCLPHAKWDHAQDRGLGADGGAGEPTTSAWTNGQSENLDADWALILAPICCIMLSISRNIAFIEVLIAGVAVDRGGWMGDTEPTFSAGRLLVGVGFDVFRAGT